jgi:hypothetical protein
LCKIHATVEDVAPTLPVLLPLPLGEGRGEGFPDSEVDETRPPLNSSDAGTRI